MCFRKNGVNMVIRFWGECACAQHWIIFQTTNQHHQCTKRKESQWIGKCRLGTQKRKLIVESFCHQILSYDSHVKCINHVYHTVLFLELKQEVRLFLHPDRNFVLIISGEHRKHVALGQWQNSVDYSKLLMGQFPRVKSRWHSIGIVYSNGEQHFIYNSIGNVSKGIGDNGDHVIQFSHADARCRWRALFIPNGAFQSARPHVGVGDVRLCSCLNLSRWSIYHTPIRAPHRIIPLSIALAHATCAAIQFPWPSPIYCCTLLI